jgi:hypothetical protein
MQRPAGTMAIRHRSSSNRTAGKPLYRFNQSRAGRRADWADPAQIWRGPARSGLFTFFVPKYFSVIELLLHSKLLRKYSRPPKIVIQIFL